LAGADQEDVRKEEVMEEGTVVMVRETVVMEDVRKEEVMEEGTVVMVREMVVMEDVRKEEVMVREMVVMADQEDMRKGIRGRSAHLKEESESKTQTVDVLYTTQQNQHREDAGNVFKSLR
jgi:hypothetical protein